METARIDLKGIQNNAPLDQIEDGASNEIINLRHKNGAWRPVGKKKELFALTKNYEDIFVHQTPSGQKNYIGKVGIDLFRFKENGSTTLLYTLPSDYVGMKHIGNILLVIHKEGIAKILYSPDTDSYGEPLERFPNHPRYEVTTEYWKQQEEAIEVEREVSDQEIIEDHMKTHVPGNYYAKLADLKDDKYYEGYCAVRFAYRLYDETLVVPTIPKLRFIGNKLDISHYFSNYGADKYIIKFDKITVGNIKYEIGTLPNELNNWKDIIKSICIFITRPVSYYDFSDIDIDFNNRANDLTWTDNDDKEFLKDYKRDITKEDLISKNPYYLVDEIDIEKASNHSDGIYIEHNIESNETLPVNSTHHTTIGNSSLVYNSRLMVGDTQSILFEGFNMSHFLSKRDTLNNITIYVETELSDVNGDYLVRSEVSGNFNHTQFEFEDIIGYPDSRAKRMRLMYKDTSGIIRKIRDLSALKNGNFNFSCTLPNSIELDTAITVKLLGDNNRNITITTYLGVHSHANQNGSISLRSVKNKTTNTQIIRVSELNNPFIFPATQTYTIGSDKVLTMAVNTLPISQGQFGEHPVIVLCTDGIYVLSQGNSEVLFAAVHPVNRDVCNNPDNVIGLEYGILYSTKDGLNILNGTESTLINEVLNGDQHNFLAGDPNYELFTDHEILYNLLYVLNESVDFTTYLLGAKVGYNQNKDEKELIISNTNYNYSFVYSMKSGQFHKILEVFDYFVNDYPDMLGIFENNLYILSKETKENVSIHVHTQPIKIIGRNFKTITRASLKAHIKCIDIAHKCGLYVYISNDLINWELIEGVQPSVLYNHILQRISCSSLYICVHFGAICTPDSYINSIDLSYKVKYANKLR